MFSTKSMLNSLSSFSQMFLAGSGRSSEIGLENENFKMNSLKISEKKVNNRWLESLNFNLFLSGLSFGVKADEGKVPESFLKAGPKEHFSFSNFMVASVPKSLPKKDDPEVSKQDSDQLNNLEELLEDESLPSSNLLKGKTEETKTEISPSRKRKLKPTIERENLLKRCQVVLMSGQWTPKEEYILLNLTIRLIQCELKVIAEACKTCGVLRGQRAVDKKLKRMIGFGCWKDRNIEEIVTKATNLLETRVGYNVSKRMNNKIDQAVESVLLG